MRSIIKKALALMVPILIFLVMSEVVLRVVLHYWTMYDIEMSRYALDMKLDSANPMIGHLHYPNTEGTYMNVDLRINSDGFRDREYELDPSDKRRIIVLGDSLTLGWGVEREETFEYLLEERLNAIRPTEMINFGAGNYNTSQETHVFLEKGLKYRPDDLVLFYFINDAEPTPHRTRWAWLARFRVSTFYWGRVKALMAKTAAGAGFREFYSKLYEDDQPGWIETQRAFRLLKDVCDRYEIGLQVVILPELHNLEDYPFDNEHARVKQALDEIGIPYLDVLPAFLGEQDPTRFWVALDDAHPNAEAHRRIAESSLEFISKEAEATP